MLIFGLAMVLIMVWKPRGLVTSRDPSAVLKEKKRIGADMVARARGIDGRREGPAALGRRPDPDGRASDHALRRPGRYRRPLFQCRTRRHHRPHRPERRRQDDRLQLHHRLLQTDGGAHRAPPRPRSRAGGRGPAHRFRPPMGRAGRKRRVPAGAHAGPRDRLAREGGAHLPEHPALRRHDGSGEPACGAAQQADDRLELHDRRHLQPPRLPPRTRSGDRALRLLAEADRPSRPRRRPGSRPSLRRAAEAGDCPLALLRTAASLPR